MFKIQKQEKEKILVDLCIKSMQEYAQKQRNEITKRYSKIVHSKNRTKEETNLNKRKDLEIQKISYLNFKINNQLKKIIKSFPNFKKIPKIYIDLINTSDTNTNKIQDALARILWIINSVEELTENSVEKLKRCKTQNTASFIMKKYLGKINSYYNKNKTYFKLLRDSTSFINKLPTLETNIYTVSISGFPNVGKSTLMKKLSKSNVEIQDYPFTTKKLMLGYIKNDKTKIIQLIDTPGLLGRDKNNYIEQKSNIIMTSFCNIIVFVLDLTETCGYSIENQIKLLKKTSKIEKEIIIYLSKFDIYDSEEKENMETIEQKYKKYPIFQDMVKLKKFILEKEMQAKKKIDLSYLKLIK